MALVGERALTAIGVDLAWGMRARTGLCACDDDGYVLDSASVVSDDEIATWIAQWWEGDGVMAIDAPLVVRNETGSRSCERELTRVFGRYYAGAYPANLRLLRGRVHAAELATRFGLTADVNAVEVYPHAALVALGGLDRRIAYKARSGRTLEFRRSEFRRLVDTIESFDRLRASTAPRWPVLVDALETAETNAKMDLLEDELDAYVCAQVALMVVHHDERLHRFGDADTGCIVTPLPAGERVDHDDR